MPSHLHLGVKVNELKSPQASLALAIRWQSDGKLQTRLNTRLNTSSPCTRRTPAIPPFPARQAPALPSPSPRQLSHLRAVTQTNEKWMKPWMLTLAAPGAPSAKRASSMTRPAVPVASGFVAALPLQPLLFTESLARPLTRTWSTRSQRVKSSWPPSTPSRSSLRTPSMRGQHLSRCW